MGTNDETFILEMIDPCDPPDSLVAPNIDDVVYEIGSGEMQFVHPRFTVTPAACPVEY